MLRFLSERRAWVVATLAVLALLAGLSMWGAPRAKARAAQLIGERLGLTTEIGETDVSIGRVRLRGVTMSGAEGGVSVRVDEVDARMSLLGALFRGAGAVRSVSARGVRVEVDLGQEGVAEAIASIRRKLTRRGGGSSESSAGSDASRTRGRSYEVSELDVRVSDRDGALIALRGVRASKDGEQIRASASGTLLGDRDADHAYVGATTLALRRTNGSWTLSTLSIEEGSVRSLRNGDGAKRALALRVNDAVSMLRSPAEPASPTAEPTPPAEPTGQPAPQARLFTRLSPDAVIDVSNVQIESRTSEAGRVERIRDFALAVHGGNNGWYRVEVGGETSNKGTLNVDLSLMPSEARADGIVELKNISLALIAPFVPELPLYDPELGTISTTMELTADSANRIAFNGGLRIRELALSSERIAAQPVEHINFDVNGKGAWLPNERRLEIELAKVRMNEARAMIDGEIERTAEHYRIDLTAKLPPTDCNHVVGAIPEDVLRSLTRFEWSGNWSALTHISLDSRDLDATELSIRVRNLCMFERTPNWVRVERFQEPFRHRAVEPDETVFQMVTGPGTDNWVAFEDISPFMVPSVISHEDGAFYEHGGFAPWAIRDALVRNLQEGRYVVGASTISMQLAKNLYLQREKTIARKAQEVILTWWLENALTKDQILELYLNVIEYGPSVYGLRQASLYYFGREPADLSPAETAFLACMLPSPKRYHVSYERGELSRSMKNRMRRLLEHMAKRERIGPEALAYGLAELDDFQFHKDGELPPPPRFLPPLGAPVEPDPNEVDPYETLFVSP